MHRVGDAIFRHGADSGTERLGEDLATKNAGGPFRALAQKQVFVDRFDFEVVEQFFQVGGQGDLRLV